MILMITFQFDKHYAQYKQVTFLECRPFFSVKNELPVIGQHFIANDTNNDGSNQPPHNINGATKVIQKLLQSPTLQPSTSQQCLSDQELAEIVRLHKLVPGPENDELVGSKLLSEDFEKDAQPIPHELVDNQIDWVKHGFYTSFGN